MPEYFITRRSECQGLVLDFLRFLVRGEMCGVTDCRSRRLIMHCTAIADGIFLEELPEEELDFEEEGFYA